MMSFLLVYFAMMLKYGVGSPHRLASLEEALSQSFAGEQPGVLKCPLANFRALLHRAQGVEDADLDYRTMYGNLRKAALSALDRERSFRAFRYICFLT